MPVWARHTRPCAMNCDSESSHFARVSGVRDWLTEFLPGLRFTR
jgi:hypothetical protein